jgi:hypothetical protein
MPLSRNIGKRMSGTFWTATVPAFVVLSSLLVAQNVPLEFPSVLVGQSSITAGSTHAQAQRFDSDGLQWTAPVGAFVILPAIGRVNRNFTQPLLPAIQTKGFHFNRPPPTN